MSLDQAGTGRRGGYYHGWNVVAATILSQVFVNGIACNCFSLFVREWSQEFRTPVSQMQLAIALSTLGASLISPLIGAIADKRPARQLLLVGLLSAVVCELAVSWSNAPWQIVTLYALVLPFSLSFGSGVTTNSLISRWFVRRVGLAFGLSALGLGMAGVALPPIISHLLEHISWRVIWRVSAAVGVVIVTPIVIAACRNRPDPEKDGLSYLTADGQPAKVDPHHPASEPNAVTFRSIFTNKSFWLLIGIVMPLLAVNVGVGFNLAPYAAAHGFSRNIGGLFISTFSLFQMAAALGLGLLVDRYGSRLALAGLVVAAVIACALLAISPSLPVIFVAVALIGALSGALILLPASLAAIFGAGGFGRAYGSAILFLPLAVFTASIIAKVQETTGSYTPGLVGAAVAMVLPGGLLFFLREPSRT